MSYYHPSAKYKRLSACSDYSDSAWDGKVTVSFSYAQYGWIQLWICTSAYLQSVTIHLSDVEDPFLDLQKWLESIAEGRYPCSLDIDEEGCVKTLTVEEVGVDKLDFTITSEEDNALDFFRESDDAAVEEPFIVLRCRVSAKQLVREFVRKLNSFITDYLCLDGWNSGWLRQVNLTRLLLLTQDEWIEYINPLFHEHPPQ
ncbi:MAG: hypothetical protein LLG44_12640 [Chloroflexi bacterium]|nr:hypothetical protein [Chloroflexota bacterium]